MSEILKEIKEINKNIERQLNERFDELVIKIMEVLSPEELADFIIIVEKMAIIKKFKI